MSARRAARAAAGAPAVLDLRHVDVLELLHDADAPLWHDREAYRAFMAKHGWSLPVGDRMGSGTHPANRRNAAADAWGAENGIESQSGHADWHQLRQMGVIA